MLSADGQVDTIEGTTIHPVWSLDRDDWVPLGELTEGEQLLGAAGPATIINHQIFHRSTPVYNIEVHGEHVYEVGAVALIAHNSCEDAMRRLSGTVKVDIRNLRLAPGGREFADPTKLKKFVEQGWQWEKYDEPIEVFVGSHGPTLMNGVTRVEAALRAGISHLPAIVRRS